MLAALLCPGSLLVKYAGRGEYGAVVAVNRAAIQHGCDVWMALDLERIRQTRSLVVGKPKLLTNAGTLAALVQQDGPIENAMVVDDLHRRFPTSFNWIGYSASCGAVYLASIGATRIDCYGMDWRGTKDFDGVEAGDNRTDDRWAKEEAVWVQLTDRLKWRGVEVRRIV